MISLDSNIWATLSHAYGPAEDIPDLLRALENYPQKSEYEDEPYYTLWSSLCHQGDVYSASYAAVPHVLALAEKEPLRATYDYLLLPVMIEIARAKGRGPKVPPELESDYLGALRRMPAIVGAIGARRLDETWIVTCGAAIAACNGHALLAEAILELQDSAEEFLEWKFSQ